MLPPSGEPDEDELLLLEEELLLDEELLLEVGRPPPPVAASSPASTSVSGSSLPQAEAVASTKPRAHVRSRGSRREAAISLG